MKTNLKIFTSYVSPEKLESVIAGNYLPLFIIRDISNSELIGKYSDTAVHFKDLAPSSELIWKRNMGAIDKETFEKNYIIELSSQNFPLLTRKMEHLAEMCNASGVVLFGIGKDPLCCYRSVLSDILNKSGLINDFITEL